MGKNGIIIICICVCLINGIICSLSSKDARTLNRKIKWVRIGIENKLVSALDDLRDSIGTCKCTDWNKTMTDLIVGQLGQSTSNGVESRDDSSKTAEERIMKSFQVEKEARKGFEHKMLDMVKDQTKSPVHGGWTDWAQWGECSQSCGTGLMKRFRQCSNPNPGPYGNPCFGDYTDIKQCILQECTQVDGGWSDWTSWSTCSVTCNGGLKTRDRNCNNPRPSSQGRYCDGRNMDCQSCRTKTCPDPIVFFSVLWPHDSMVNNVVVFQVEVETSSGNDFSTSTGKFTCKIPGLYHFSVTFNSYLKSGSDGVTYCKIFKNQVNKVHVLNSAFGKSGYDNWRSASASVYLSLDTGDTVWVGACWGWDNIAKGGTFHFVGALITAS